MPLPIAIGNEDLNQLRIFRPPECFAGIEKRPEDHLIGASKRLLSLVEPWGEGDFVPDGREERLAEEAVMAEGELSWRTMQL
jgi:hypothetical protein